MKAPGKCIGGVFERPFRRFANLIVKLIGADYYDESAAAAVTAMGDRNVMFGSDYPHLEGTYGHTQEALHGLFDGVDEDTTCRITRGAFLDLFPEVGQPAALAA